jgi:hypothetical protein
MDRGARWQISYAAAAALIVAALIVAALIVAAMTACAGVRPPAKSGRSGRPADPAGRPDAA